MNFDSEYIKISGLTEVMSLLNELPPSIEKNVLIGFEKDTLKKYYLSPIRNGIKTSTGKNYSNASLKGIKIKTVTGEIASKGYLSPGAYKVKWNDIGTNERFTKKGASRGTIKAAQYISPIIDANILPMVKNIEENFTQYVQKTLDRKAKKYR
jgi:hypothetical protein